MRFALLLCLCLVGCIGANPKPPAPPKPDAPTPVADGTIAGVGRDYEADFRESCLKAAAKLRSGEWKTDREYRDGHKGLRKIAVEHSGQPWADRQEREATPFDPLKMAEWLEKVAREGQP